MSKFTDEFFEFPVKVYDSFSLRKVEEEEDSMNLRLDMDWVSGKAKVHVHDLLKGFYYQESFSGKTVEEVKEEGFDYTSVFVTEYGEFICTWPIRKFEAKINDFMAKHLIEEEEESKPEDTL